MLRRHVRPPRPRPNPAALRPRRRPRSRRHRPKIFSPRRQDLGAGVVQGGRFARHRGGHGGRRVPGPGSEGRDRRAVAAPRRRAGDGGARGSIRNELSFLVTARLRATGSRRAVATPGVAPRVRSDRRMPIPTSGRGSAFEAPCPRSRTPSGEGPLSRRAARGCAPRRAPRPFLLAFPLGPPSRSLGGRLGKRPAMAGAAGPERLAVLPDWPYQYDGLGQWPFGRRSVDGRETGGHGGANGS